MNSTSFTSIESDTGCANSNDKMANIDSSSTAHLTLNAAVSIPVGSTRGSNNSDSDLDRSPSVMILRAENSNDSSDAGGHISHHHLNHSHLNHHHHHHHLIDRPSHLVTSGFTFSNRLHLSKNHRTIWSRASQFEKLLILAVVLLATTTILLLITIISLLVSDKRQAIVFSNNVTSLYNQQMLERFKSSPGATTEVGKLHFTGDEDKQYCITPDCVKVAASVIEAIDLKVDPCDDFYVSKMADRPPPACSFDLQLLTKTIPPP